MREEFSDRLTQRNGSAEDGPGLEEDTDVGPLVDADTADKVDRLVDATRSAPAPTSWSAAARRTGRVLLRADRPGQRGARLADPARGDLRPGGADRHVRVEAEAIEHANATEYGLVSYVYTARPGPRLAGRRGGSNAGMVGLNRGLVSDPAAPFGGVKQSGIGREGGHEGMLDYTESKYIALQW